MKRYLLDTNAVSDLINHRLGVDVRAQKAKRAGGRIGTCPPVLGELFHGLELSDTRDANMRTAKIGLRRVILWPFTRQAAEEFGRVRAMLERRGRPMQIVDMQLAAVALTLGNCTVVSTDSDLRAIPGLSVEDWAS